ncbi:AAA family ATPase [Clostridium sp. UBA7503]|uniref:ATP-binding protein n=1 Tax=Clostridium sp. UBA7503 TaxID=1946377 RepID=UPI0032168D4D
MENFKLKTLVIHNFKLFSHAVIDMDGANLVLLDGPNGYGKTSTFDALEYLFTGDIKRVANNSVNKSNISFSEDCLIKTPSDGSQTYVEGQLENQNGKILFIRRMLSSGRTNSENNPSKITNRTTTEVKFDGETICNNEKNVKKANQKIEGYLGKSLIENYNHFYYVAQEDRLKFLSKSDSDRLREIQKLFGIEKEDEILKKIGKAKIQFDTLKKRYSSLLEQKENLINGLKEQLKNKKDKQHVKYRKMIVDENINPVWDRDHPVMENQEKLVETINQIEAVGKFSQDIELYKCDNANRWVDKKERDIRNLKKMLFLHSYGDNIQELWDKLKKYNDVLSLMEAAQLDDGNNDYEQYDYKQLKELLGIEVDLEEITQIKGEIGRYRKNIGDEDAAREKIMQLQEQLIKERDNWKKQKYDGIVANQCPLCGYMWDDESALLTALQTFKDGIDSGKGDSQKLLDGETAKLKKIYLDSFEEIISQYLEDNRGLSQDICKEIYESWEKNKQEYNKFISDCKQFGVQIINAIREEELEDTDQIVENFIKDDLSKVKTNITDDYYIRNSEYQYKNILSIIYKNQLAKVKELKDEDIQNKITYVEQEYYSGKGKVIEAEKKNLLQLQNRNKKIQKIHQDILDMEEIMKQEFKNYKAKMVKQLQAPFFVYTGRILQNYPGGLGIKLDLVNDEKIRFEATNRKEHDVLYTLSSGQLSATAIALALTLNKVYTQESVKCAFIDDPIQTMDELNVSSFVEVLRNDFPDYQFILSTHEDNFSDYIRYKYQKYQLSNKPIDVRLIDVEEYAQVL